MDSRENSKQLMSDLALMQWFHKKVLTAGAILPFFRILFFQAKLPKREKHVVDGVILFGKQYYFW